MSHIADSRAPNGIGILPLQDHDPTIPIKDEDFRSAILATRIKRRQRGPGALGHWEEDPERRGDLLCAMNWRRRTRAVDGWAFAWPAITDATKASGPGAPVQTGKPKNGMVPLRDDPHTPDMRFDTLIYVRPKVNGVDVWPVFPNGWHGIGMAATNAQKQIDYFMPTDPRLIAVNYAGNWECGSMVCDLDANDNVDPQRIARLQSSMRVMKKPSGINQPNVNVLAWQLGRTGQNDTRGGYMFDAAGTGGAPVASGSARGGNTLGGKKDEPPGAGGGGGDKGHAVGMASRNDSGFVAVGSKTDKHRLGQDQDGNVINSGHVDVDAYFRRNDDEDGPFLFEGRYEKPPKYEHFADVHLEWDPDPLHNFVGGPRKGKWRWRAEVPFYTPEKPPPPLIPIETVDPFPPPPRRPITTGGGTPVEQGPIPGDAPPPGSTDGRVDVPTVDETWRLFNPPTPGTPVETGPVAPPVPPGSPYEPERFPILTPTPRPTSAPIGVTSDSEPREFVATLHELAFPSIIFRPVNLAEGATDTTQDVASVDLKKYDNTAPVTIGIAAFGQEGGCEECGAGGEGDPALPATGFSAQWVQSQFDPITILSGAHFILDDGVNPAVTFEYHTGGGTTIPGATGIDVSPYMGGSVLELLEATAQAINDDGTLAITCLYIEDVLDTEGHLELENDAVGAFGNVAIVNDSQYDDGGGPVEFPDFTGMSGGQDASEGGDEDCSVEECDHHVGGDGTPQPPDPWVYNRRPGQGQYRGGTTNGGIVFMAPEAKIADYRRGFLGKPVATLSEVYVLAGPNVRWGAGRPETVTGGLRGGFSWGVDSSTLDLEFKFHDDTAPANAGPFPYFTVTADSNLAWYETGGTGLFRGEMQHANTTDRLWEWPDLDGTVLLGPSGGGLLTEGSVLFVAPDGSITEDNANFFWDDTGNCLCIGTNNTVASTVKLYIVGGVNQNNFAIFDNYAASSTDRFGLIGRRARGTEGTPTTTLTGDVVFDFGAQAHDGTAFRNLAVMQYRVDTRTGTDDISGKIMLLTRPNGVAAGNVERFTLYGDGSVVVNETGIATDFRVETDDDPNAIFVDGSEDFIGFGTALPLTKVDINGGLATRMTTNAQLTANQNDYAIGAGTCFRLSSDATRDITGMTGGVDGKHLEIFNVGANRIRFTHLDGASAAANQIITSSGGTVSINANQSIKFRYDATSTAWRMLE